MSPLVFATMFGLCLLVAASMGQLIFALFSVERLRFIRGIALRSATFAFLTAVVLGTSLLLTFVLGQ